MNRSHEAARALMKKAKGDRHACHRLLDDPLTPAWIVGFHAQQAVEKAIKAVLASASVEFPRTHNLTMLVELLRKNNLSAPPNEEELAVLTPFGTVLRYDDLLPEEDLPLDRTRAAACVDQVLSWAESSLPLPPS